MADARFEDGAETPLALAAADPEDMKILSALVQDAVLTAADITYIRSKRQVALLLNRFRWENGARVSPPERVRALLLVDDVLSMAAQGISPQTPDVVLSLLSVEWRAAQDGMGRLTLTFAGDGALALEVEAINLMLRDVTKPYAAPSGKVPTHP
ncbi:DUF2948 family protein [Rhodobacteraceae bacterium XHP0102]|nr:DUF2948 family protein [Rhodobacteraceae bacterium XHP0102]